MHALTLDLLAAPLAICRLAPDQAAPPRPANAPFWSETRTPAETSLVIPERHVDQRWRVESGWRALRVRGPLPFEQVGVLCSLLTPLADAGVSVFSLSTYDTDYVLLRARDLDRALLALTLAGHTVVPEAPGPWSADHAVAPPAHRPEQ